MTKRQFLEGSRINIPMPEPSVSWASYSTTASARLPPGAPLGASAGITLPALQDAARTVGHATATLRAGYRGDLIGNEEGSTWGPSFP